MAGTMLGGRSNVSRKERIEEALHLILDREGGHVALMEGFLIDSIGRASRSADKLSRRVFWLNLLILIVGTIGLIIAAYGVFN